MQNNLQDTQNKPKYLFTHEYFITTVIITIIIVIIIIIASTKEVM